jgi:hypothetical protein
MRELTDHIVEGDSANHQLKIEVVDSPGQGGACHRYEISGLDTAGNSSNQFTGYGYERPRPRETILFQNGPIKEFGVNGVTHEALLAIVIDRLRSFQVGPFASGFNGESLVHCEAALKSLQDRTRARIARGVEGTHQK